MAPMGRARAQILDEIAEVIGEEAMRAFWRYSSGNRVYFPGRVRLNHWLVQVVGLEAAGKLCAHFSVGTTFTRSGKVFHYRGGIDIDMPVFREEATEQERRVAAGIGLSVNEAARSLGVTYRTIYRRRAALRKTLSP
jgi:hypothetical protein